MENLKAKKIKLEILLQDDENPRIHNRRNIDAIKDSIQKYGQYRPFVVNQRTGKIAVGNGMLTAMKELGFTKGNAIFMDLSEEDFRLLSIADNRSADMSVEDPMILLKRLKSIPEELRDLTGYSKVDISILELENEYGEIKKEDYVRSEKEEDTSEREFVFSSLHFSITDLEYAKWKKAQGLDDMDKEEAVEKLKIMLGVKDE